MMSNCDVVTFPFGILGQVWCLIALIPELCPLSYFGFLRRNLAFAPRSTKEAPYKTLVRPKLEIVSEYDQEIPQPQTADKPITS